MPTLRWSEAEGGLGLPKRCGSDFFFFFSASWAARFFGSSKRFFGGPLMVAGSEVVRASVLVLSGSVSGTINQSSRFLFHEIGSRNNGIPDLQKQPQLSRQLQHQAATSPKH